MIDFTRFKRQLNLEHFGEEKQEILQKSKVFIGGVGGVGGTTAIYLVCSGVAELSICHYGNLEIPDLNRQILMNDERVGHPRVDIAREFLERFDKNLKITTFNERINDSNIDDMLYGCNLAISARPNFYERLAIAKGCIKHKIPMIDGAIYDMFGHIFTMLPGKTACYYCLFDTLPENWKELEFPVLGAFSGLIGTIMAIEAIKLLTNWHKSALGELITIDGVSYEINKVRINKKKNCFLCGEINYENG